MTLPLSPEMVEAAYDFLKITPPFNRWNLPDGEDVKFTVVSARRNEYGRYRWDGSRHHIALSSRAIGHSVTLLEKLSHEMIHLVLEETGAESRTGGMDAHNPAFRKLAAEVCKVHGFDLKAYY